MSDRGAAIGRFVLAVDGASPNLTADDRHLQDALLRLGVEAEPRVWGEPLVGPLTVVVRSTWDYVERPGEFRMWLDHLEASGIAVHNPTKMLRWNMHKGYLIAMAEHCIPVVPTRLVSRGDNTSVAALRDETGWRDLVVKPAIGGTARLTMHTARVDPTTADAHLAELLRHEDVVVQPYMESITSIGEISIVAIAGSVTHAVAKLPASGDWRVQSEFGGTAGRIEVTSELVEFATRTLDTLDVVPAYARVDVVRDHGQLRLLEFELIEPELFFRLAPHAADTLAAHLLDVARRTPPNHEQTHDTEAILRKAHHA